MQEMTDLSSKSGNKESGAALGVASSDEPVYNEISYHEQGRWQDFKDSFKRDPNASIIASKVGLDLHAEGYDVEGAAAATVNTGLARKLKGRHLQMIAIGGSIGTGLFVGSGGALSSGGPASLLIAFALIGAMLYCTVHALGEMAVLFPVAGSFSAYSTRFLDPSWGFAMGWNYAMQWLVVLPLEIIAATLTINFWNNGRINNDAWVAIFLVFIVIINFFGVKGYGEAEFVFASIKIIAVIGFIILGVILVCGGGPQGQYLGGQYWHDPGAFHNGFKGLCSVFVTAAFAFAGTELVGLAAAETSNPRRSLPTAIKQVFWRITLFYIVSLTLVGLLVPYNNPDLLDGTSGADAKASPFVIAINNAGISVLPSVMNVVIMIAVLSVGNSSIYGSSRTLAALAVQGQAPSILGYVDRSGRPLVAIIVASLFGFLAFFAGSDKQTIALSWMIALSGLSSIFTWASICLCHIRFRRAWRLQGHSLNELAFRSQPGVIGSWVGFSFNILVLAAQFWIGAWPVGYGENTPAQNVNNFFLAYLAAPVVILCYAAHKVYYKTPLFIRSHDMDLRSGVRELNLVELRAEEAAERAHWPKWKKFYKFLC